MIFLCVFFIPSPFAVYIRYFIEKVMSMRVFRRRVGNKFWRHENKLVVDADRIEPTSSVAYRCHPAELHWETPKGTKQGTLNIL